MKKIAYNPISAPKISEILGTITNLDLKKELQQFQSLFNGKACYIFEEDLTLEEKFVLDVDVLIIQGNLEVAGNIITSNIPDNDNFLIILGNVTCHNILANTGSSTFISGKLNVSTLLFTSMRDSIFYTADDISAKYIYSGNGAGWITSLAGKINCSVLSDYIENTNGNPKKDIDIKMKNKNFMELFNDSVLIWEEWDELDSDEKKEAEEEKFDYCVIDEDVVYELFIKNKTVLKSTAI